MKILSNYEDIVTSGVKEAVLYLSILILSSASYWSPRFAACAVRWPLGFADNIMYHDICFNFYSNISFRNKQ